MTQHIEYSKVLERFLSERREVDLMRAYELGKNYQHQHITPDALLAMHMEALDKLSPTLTEEERLREVMASFSFLLEAMIAYGIAYSDAYQLLERAAMDAENAKYELERLVADLDLANQQMQEVDRLKSRFFANMNHELRTPLNAIISCTEDVMDGLVGELTPGQHRYLQIARDAGTHLLAVINEILDLAKLKSGTLHLTPAAFALESVFQELHNTLQPLAAKKGQTLQMADASQLTACWGERQKTMQILLNLGSNALKFTPAGKTISFQFQALGDMVEIAVEDEGMGISAVDLPTIFEEFRQVDPLRQDSNMKGTGLGLAITQQLVKLQGGEIRATSTVGKGSRFVFSLPLVRGS